MSSYIIHYESRHPRQTDDESAYVIFKWKVFMYMWFKQQQQQQHRNPIFKFNLENNYTNQSLINFIQTLMLQFLYLIQMLLSLSATHNTLFIDTAIIIQYFILFIFLTLRLL